MDILMNKYDMTGIKSNYWSSKTQKSVTRYIQSLDTVYYIVGTYKKTEYSFIIFKHKQTISDLSKLSNNVRWLVRSQEDTQSVIQSITEKCGKISTNGTLPKKPKKQTQQEILYDAIRRGCQVHDLLDIYPLLYSKNKKFCIDMIESCNENAPKPKPQVIVIIGDTGVGKSYAVRSKYGSNLYTTSVIHNKKSNSLYFNGYFYHKAVLFDDYDDTSMSITNLLRIIDEYPVLVQRQRRTAINFIPQIIIFTSNIHPSEWYNKSPKTKKAALLRRITMIHDMRKSDRKSILTKMPDIINTTQITDDKKKLNKSTFLSFINRKS